MAEAPVPRWSLPTRDVAWSVPAVLRVPFAIASLEAGPARLAPWRVLVVLTATWQVWAPLTGPVLALADRHPLERPWRARAVAAHLGASVAACAALVALRTSERHRARGGRRRRQHPGAPRPTAVVPVSRRRQAVVAWMLRA